jgi:hypothetical protein
VRIRRGWQLTRKSWALVRRDRRLLVFPTASALLGLAVGGAIAYWGSGHGRWGYLAAAAIVYFPSTLVSSYLGVAFIALARRALDGQPYTLRDGFRCATSRLPALVVWSALATVVLLLLQALQNLRGGWLAGKVASWLLGLAWAAAAFFVIPVLALDGVDAIEALRRSARLVKSRWGEAATGVTAIGGAFVLAILPAGILIGIGVAAWPSGAAKALIAIGVAIVAVTLPLQTTTMQMFQLVLYRYAAAGDVAPGFTDEELEHAFRQRRRGLFRRKRD